ncbi:high mobility group protein DSP1-like [Sitophilus oryzae]|uniref:High mobility group protein DSP1-like n=1 Tax=Sitophilus oryzae TaxID=7048 RepID=A0A6J2YGR8_SITOR|nr:high mobility group protein DSP1-like [Sitophilus oryzae]
MWTHLKTLRLYSLVIFSDGLFYSCRSAFFWFSNDERSKVKAANPEYGVGDIAKELGRRWAEADPETRSKYDVLADKDKIRYEKEMTAYKKKNNPALQQQAVPDDIAEDDDDVDDDEDE